jgi:hypothetical protein
MLKNELVHHRRYATQHEAMQEITEYINLSKIVRYRGTREPVFQPSQPLEAEIWLPRRTR